MKIRLLLIVALYVALSAVVFASGPGETAPVDSRGVIEFYEGEVYLEDEEVFIGQEVPPGATIRTGPDSSCEIVFGGANIFHINENCTAVLYIDREQRRIDLKTGSIAFVFQKLFSSLNEFLKVVLQACKFLLEDLFESIELGRLRLTLFPGYHIAIFRLYTPQNDPSRFNVPS